MSRPQERALKTASDEDRKGSSSDTSIIDDSDLEGQSEELRPPLIASAVIPSPIRATYGGLSQLLGPLVRVVSETGFDERGHGINQAAIQIYNTILQEYQNDLMDPSSADFCRICRDTDSRENFLSPCHCKGTLGHVHLTCLQRWLAESDTSFCELCGYQYNTTRVPKYSLTSALVTWCTCFSSQDLVFDTLAFCAFTPIAMLGTYLGVVAGDTLDMYDDTGPVYVRTLTLGVVSLMAAIDFAYIGWLLIRLQYHFHHW